MRFPNGFVNPTSTIQHHHEGPMGKLRRGRYPISEISKGPIRHASLPASQEEQLHQIFDTFSELGTLFAVSFEEVLLNFRRDVNPASEIAVWQQIADAYKQIVSQNPRSSIEQRKEAFIKLVVGPKEGNGN